MARAEALESVMCDVVKIRLKRIATRSGKGNQPLNIKTAIERPILKLVCPNFSWSFLLISLLVASFLFRRIFMTSHMILSSASRAEQRRKKGLLMYWLRNGSFLFIVIVLVYTLLMFFVSYLT